MRKYFLLFMFILLNSLISVEIAGTWVFSRYDHNEPYNTLDIINITKVDNNEYLIQHSYYIFSEMDYFVRAEMDSEGKLSYVDPNTEWKMVLSARNWGLHNEVLECYPELDRDFIAQYIRIDTDFLTFLKNIDEWIEKNEYVKFDY